ncbi:MAG TPA: ribonuclease Z [Longimicrobiaceae bacterium]|jgi:ribonuclease Z|nr:ribonuclease Z [Longimicrobiaceae bacterium]
MRVTFLGTAAARPTVGRNVSSLVIQREGDVMVFDCGEGTQRQMMRYGTGFSFNDIFFTHLHADHFLGVIGLLRTLGLQAREEPVDLWTPRGTEPLLRQAVDLGVERVPFEVRIHGLDHGEAVERGAYAIVPFRTQHGPRSLGYGVVENERLGRFNAAKAREMGIPEGPLWGKLHHGETVDVDGRTVTAADVVGPPRPGKRVVYTGDTRPAPATREAAAGADLLIHEATFAHDEADRAVATGHSTAREAAEVAADAGVLRLALTHFSPRYADDPRFLEREARAVFPEVVSAYDGLVIEVPYRDE